MKTISALVYAVLFLALVITLLSTPFLLIFGTYVGFSGAGVATFAALIKTWVAVIVVSLLGVIALK